MWLLWVWAAGVGAINAHAVYTSFGARRERDRRRAQATVSQWPDEKFPLAILFSAVSECGFLLLSALVSPSRILAWIGVLLAVLYAQASYTAYQRLRTEPGQHLFDDPDERPSLRAIVTDGLTATYCLVFIVASIWRSTTPP